MKLDINSSNPLETENIAEAIGKSLRGGEVVELVSDVGGGKTTFTRGLAKAIQSNDKVASPTFTISRVYSGREVSIYHFDFYRLNSAGLMSLELSDAMKNKKNVVVVEWPDIIEGALPKTRLKVEFSNTGINGRKLVFTYPKSLAYLLNNLVSD